MMWLKDDRTGLEVACELEQGEQTLITFPLCFSFRVSACDEVRTYLAEYDDYSFGLICRTDSSYLQWFKANATPYSDVMSFPLAHYILWAENNIVDVIAAKPPKVTLLRDGEEPRLVSQISKTREGS